MIAPLFGRKELLGVIILTHEQEKYFNLDHLLLLQAIASQAAIAVENARLYSNIAQEQKRLAAVLQHATEAILVFDAQGKLILLNPAGEKLFTDFKANIKQALPLGRGYDTFINMLEDARRSQGAKSSEILWPDQRTFVTLITPIEDGGQVATMHDVTRFKDLDKVKNEFIVTASHDLKNPLTTITGFSHLLAATGPLSEQQLEFVKRIQSAANNMSELVQNMMELVSIDLDAAQKHEEIELGALLAELAHEFRPQSEAKSQSFDMTLVSPALINGDPLQLKQLFRNLIGNAIKYTPQGGTVLITSSGGPEQIHINIKDSGYGIPAKDLPFIFDRFYRVHNNRHDEIEGNGLGLAIVKSIVDRHDGQISVESEVGKGSCFTFTLPLHMTQGTRSTSFKSNTLAKS